MAGFNELIVSLGIPQSVVNVFASYPYGLIFVALLIGGGIILFPAFYLAIIGVLNEWLILLVMVLATIIADAFWYSVGRGIVPKFIQRLTERRRMKYLERASDFIAGRELIMLFYSKFVYGTRIAAQVICGARKVHFLSFIGVNVAAVCVLGVIYYALVRTAWTGVGSIDDFKYKLIILMALAVVVLGSLHYGVYRLIKKRNGA